MKGDRLGGPAVTRDDDARRRSVAVPLAEARAILASGTADGVALAQALAALVEALESACTVLAVPGDSLAILP